MLTPASLVLQPNEKGLNALEFATSEPRMHTFDPAHPEQVLRLLVQTGVPCSLWRIEKEAKDGAGAPDKPGSRLIMLRWLRARRPGSCAPGMDSPVMSLDAILEMNDRLVQEYLFQRRKWILDARNRLCSSAESAGAAGDACATAHAVCSPSTSTEEGAVGLSFAGTPSSARSVQLPASFALKTAAGASVGSAQPVRTGLAACVSASGASRLEGSPDEPEDTEVMDVD